MNSGKLKKFKWLCCSFYTNCTTSNQIIKKDNFLLIEFQWINAEIIGTGIFASTATIISKRKQNCVSAEEEHPTTYELSLSKKKKVRWKGALKLSLSIQLLVLGNTENRKTL